MPPCVPRDDRYTACLGRTENEVKKLQALGVLSQVISDTTG